MLLKAHTYTHRNKPIHIVCIYLLMQMQTHPHTCKHASFSTVSDSASTIPFLLLPLFLVPKKHRHAYPNVKYSPTTTQKQDVLQVNIVAISFTFTLYLQILLLVVPFVFRINFNPCYMLMQNTVYAISDKKRVILQQSFALNANVSMLQASMQTC